jgi:CheY-like chemotaxis protein
LFADSAYQGRIFHGVMAGILPTSKPRSSSDPIGSRASSSKVAKDYPDLSVLLMTGYAAERQRAHNLDALIQDVISKPFTLQEIREAVRKLLAIQPPCSQEDTVH